MAVQPWNMYFLWYENLWFVLSFVPKSLYTNKCMWSAFIVRKTNSTMLNSFFAKLAKQFCWTILQLSSGVLSDSNSLATVNLPNVREPTFSLPSLYSTQSFLREVGEIAFILSQANVQKENSTGPWKIDLKNIWPCSKRVKKEICYGKPYLEEESKPLFSLGWSRNNNDNSGWENWRNWQTLIWISI